MILGKIKYPAVYICVCMAVWGVVSACMAAVQSFGGLVAARFCIGLVEAAFFPGALFYLSLFYNRRQYAFRVAMLYSGSQLGNAFGGLFAIGILTLDGVHGIEGWRWVCPSPINKNVFLLIIMQLFLIEGALTVGLALMFAFILPNSPETLRWVTPAEKEWIKYNFEKDQGQQDDSSEVGAGKGFKLAAVDPKTWLMMATLYAIYIAAAVTNFFPSVVATLGYSRNETYGLTAVSQSI
jgi:MFS family permease